MITIPPDWKPKPKTASKWTPPETLELFCRGCKDWFTVPFSIPNTYLTHCTRCEEERKNPPAMKVLKPNEEQMEAKRHAARVERWEQFCPKDYQNSDRGLLPFPTKLDEVLKWEYGETGLILMGGTGAGKTRCAWALMRRLFFQGKQVRYLDSMAGLEYASIYSDSARKVEAWLYRLIECDVLMLDDVFKSKMTDSFEGAVFALIDQRMAIQKPCIITCNDTGDTLKARLSADRADPMLRRIRECCQQVHFV